MIQIVSLDQSRTGVLEFLPRRHKVGISLQRDFDGALHRQRLTCGVRRVDNV